MSLKKIILVSTVLAFLTSCISSSPKGLYSSTPYHSDDIHYFANRNLIFYPNGFFKFSSFTDIVFVNRDSAGYLSPCKDDAFSENGIRIQGKYQIKKDSLFLFHNQPSKEFPSFIDIKLSDSSKVEMLEIEILIQEFNQSTDIFEPINYRVEFCDKNFSPLHVEQADLNGKCRFNIEKNKKNKYLLIEGWNKHILKFEVNTLFNHKTFIRDKRAVFFYQFDDLDTFSYEIKNKTLSLLGNNEEYRFYKPTYLKKSLPSYLKTSRDIKWYIPLLENKD